MAMKHMLIPKQTKLSEKEKSALLEKYGVTVNELPWINLNDPSLAGLEVDEGDIIKIERDSPTCGRTVFYRGVMNE
ncbi:DNA-directed RNA polymerase subunit RpoH/Rpb5 C-terminal domain-containing protein [Nanoarchaeota archaeon]